MAPTPNTKRLLRLGVVLNVTEQGAIPVANFWLNQIPFKVFKQARATRYDQNFLVIIIYLALCKKCHLQYIGSTTTDFRVRFCNHKLAMVTKKKTCEVAVHFNKTPHDLSDFSFQCIDQVQATANNSCNTEKLLITKEAYWSAQLFSLAPFSLNKRQEFHSKKRINYN